MLPQTYRVRISRRAADEVEAVFQYVSQHSPQNAPKLAERLLDAIGSLDALPHRYKVVETDEDLGGEVRSMPVAHTSSDITWTFPPER